MKHGALVHDAIDDVAVVIRDTGPGTELTAVTLSGEQHSTVSPIEDIPLGHKIALRDIAAGDQITKYGRSIGKATQDIARGAYVHTHNITTVRWAQNG